MQDSGAPGRRQPIRVCVVAPSTRILGGQAVQATRLLRGLEEMQELEVSFLPINPSLPGLLGRLQGIKYVRTLLTESVYLAALISRLRHCDVVHIFSASYSSFLLAPTPALLIARLFGRGTVLNYRSGEAADHLERWRSAVPTLRLADMLVVPSGYLVDVFRKHGLEPRVIANVVDLDRFRYRARNPLKPVFLANRNFDAHYNVACVIRAFCRVRARFPAARLTIAGDGSERENLRRLVRELGSDGIEFVGRVSPERMPALYSEADIYLNAPNIDNMPASIIEAFASGTPVVTTAAGGIPYIVEDGVTGLLVSLDDDEALAAAAMRLLDDPDLAAGMSARAYEECRRKYEWSAVRREWLQLYRDVAGRRSAPDVGAGLLSKSDPGQ